MSTAWRSYSLRGWVAIGAAVGGIVPVLATAYYIGLGVTAGPELLVIWPTSLGLMAAESATGPIENAIIWILCAAPNVALYALVGAALHVAYRFVVEFFP